MSDPIGWACNRIRCDTYVEHDAIKQFNLAVIEQEDLELTLTSLFLAARWGCRPRPVAEEQRSAKTAPHPHRPS